MSTKKNNQKSTSCWNCAFLGDCKTCHTKNCTRFLNFGYSKTHEIIIELLCINCHEFKPYRISEFVADNGFKRDRYAYYVRKGNKALAKFIRETDSEIKIVKYKDRIFMFRRYRDE